MNDDDDTNSALPMIPETNQDKNQQLISIYHEQLEKSKKRLILGVDKETIIQETNKMVIREKATQFIESQNKKTKDKIKLKSMSTVDKSRANESNDQRQFAVKNIEKKRIEAHKETMDHLLEIEKLKMKQVDTENEEPIFKRQFTTVS